MNPILTAGILFGLGAAVFQAASYIFSRRFMTECHSDPMCLFALSHAVMGVAALTAFPVLLRGSLPAFSHWAWPLAGTAGSYMIGQFLLFTALRTRDSSMIAPLLGFKIPILALTSLLLLERGITPWGWVGIAGCVTAGLIISPPAGLPGIGTLLLVGLACLGYCGSDLCIPVLVRRLGDASPHPALLGVSVTYTVCGVVSLPILFRKGLHRDCRAWRYAVPHAVAWLGGMCFLFSCFALIGPVSGNMLQATRGIFAVVFGATLTRLGLLHLDNVSKRAVLAQRLGGALLMTASIVVYLRAESPGDAGNGPRRVRNDRSARNQMPRYSSVDRASEASLTSGQNSDHPGTSPEKRRSK